MNEQQIARINELYHKAKTVGLTEEEAKEQKALRKEYIQAIRMSLRGSLDRIDMENEDGTYTNLGEKHKKKYHN